MSTERFHACYCIECSNVTGLYQRVWVHDMTEAELLNHLEGWTCSGTKLWDVDFGPCPSGDGCRLRSSGCFDLPPITIESLKK